MSFHCNFCKKNFTSELIRIKHLASWRHQSKFTSVEKKHGRQPSYECVVCQVSGMTSLSEWSKHANEFSHIENFKNLPRILYANEMYNTTVSKVDEYAQGKKDKFQNDLLVIDLDESKTKSKGKKKNRRSKTAKRALSRKSAKPKLPSDDLRSDEMLSSMKHSPSGEAIVKISFRKPKENQNSVTQCVFPNDDIPQRKKTTPLLIYNNQSFSPNHHFNLLPPQTDSESMATQLSATDPPSYTSVVFENMKKVWEISQDLDKLINRENAIKQRIKKLNTTLQETKKERKRLKQMRSIALKETHKSNSHPVHRFHRRRQNLRILSFPATTTILSVPASEVQICDGITGQGDTIRNIPMITRVGSLAPSTERLQSTPDVEIVESNGSGSAEKTPALSNSFPISHSHCRPFPTEADLVRSPPYDFRSSHRLEDLTQTFEELERIFEDIDAFRLTLPQQIV